MKRRYVLKNKKRFGLLLIISTLTIFSLVFEGSVYGHREPSYSIVDVKHGDTLWSIASQYVKNEDIRETIYKIKKINNLNGNDIYAGTQLKVPVQ